MWRHITGVEQPANFFLDNDEKLERKGTYDQVKRKRKFQTSSQGLVTIHVNILSMYKH
jgi:hypothetical protein